VCVCLATVFAFAVQKQAVSYLIINQIVFYIMEHLKKLSLKNNFYKTVFFICFLN